MSEFGDWPPELLARVIKSMAPERVCRTCGEPSRRISDAGSAGGVGSLIREAREAAGMGRGDLHRAIRDGEHPTGIVYRWEADDCYPTPPEWNRLKEVLGFGDEYDHLIPDRASVTYQTDKGQTSPALKWESGIAKGKGAHSDKPGSLTRIAPNRFTDCGHNDWRPGVVLDPFGKGGTAEVAQALGRDGIEILDDFLPQMVAE